MQWRSNSLTRITHGQGGEEARDAKSMDERRYTSPQEIFAREVAGEKNIKDSEAYYWCVAPKSVCARSVAWPPAEGEKTSHSTRLISPSAASSSPPARCRSSTFAGRLRDLNLIAALSLASSLIAFERINQVSGEGPDLKHVARADDLHQKRKQLSLLSTGDYRKLLARVRWSAADGP
jgi:hypothetical protein